MTFALIGKLLRDVRWGLLVVALVLAAFECVWVKTSQRVVVEMSPFFSGLAQRGGLVMDDLKSQLFRGPGKAVQTMLGGDDVRFERALDVLAIGYLHPLMQVVLCLWAIGRAAGAIAGELDRGTMELLLAQPLARSKLIFAHLVVDLITIPVLCLSLWVGQLAGLWLMGPWVIDPDLLARFPGIVAKPPAEWLAVDPWAFPPGLWNVAAFLFASSGITMWLSARGRFRWTVVGQATLVMLVAFLVNLVGQLWEPLAPLRPFSIFFYYQPAQIIVHHNWVVELGSVWNCGKPILTVNVLTVLFGVGVVGYIVAWVMFVRRDLPAPL